MQSRISAPRYTLHILQSHEALLSTFGAVGDLPLLLTMLHSYYQAPHQDRGLWHLRNSARRRIYEVSAMSPKNLTCSILNIQCILQSHEALLSTFGAVGDLPLLLTMLHRYYQAPHQDRGLWHLRNSARRRIYEFSAMSPKNLTCSILNIQCILQSHEALLSTFGAVGDLPLLLTMLHRYYQAPHQDRGL